MINQQLLSFIKQQLQQGVTKEIISTQLLGNGWTSQDIEEGFKAVGIPVPPTPVPAPASIPPASPVSTTPILNPTPATTQNLNPNLYPHFNDTKPAVVKVRQSGKKLFFIILIIILLAVGASIYYFKDSLLSLPIIKDLFPTQNMTTSPEVPAQTNQTQTTTQTGQTDNTGTATQPTDVATDSSLSIYNDPNGLYSFSYPKDEKIIYDQDSQVSLAIDQNNNPIAIVNISTEIDNSSLIKLTGITQFKKSSFDVISTYPTDKYTATIKGDNKTTNTIYESIYVINLGSYSNKKPSILFYASVNVDDQKIIDQVETIVKSFVINKDKIIPVTQALIDAPNKEKDLEIQQEVEKLKSTAMIFYNNNNIYHTYVGFCSSSDYTDIIKYMIKPTILMNCEDGIDAYAIRSPISSGYWCIDATGYSGATSLKTGTACVK